MSANDAAVDRRCGAEGVDEGGRCKRCGLLAEEDRECPPGFFGYRQTPTPLPPSAPTPTVERIDVRMVRDTYPVCMECGERRCFHFGRSEYCTPEGFQTGNGNCYNPSDEEPPLHPVALTRAELVDALATLTALTAAAPTSQTRCAMGHPLAVNGACYTCNPIRTYCMACGGESSRHTPFCSTCDPSDGYTRPAEWDGVDRAAAPDAPTPALDPERIRKGAAILQRTIDVAVAEAVAAEREFARSCIAAIEAEAAMHYTSGKGGPRLERALEDVMATCVIQLNRLHERALAAAAGEGEEHG